MTEAGVFPGPFLFCGRKGIHCIPIVLNIQL